MGIEFKPRKIKFKAWNKDSRLLMRLNSIDCNKGELLKKDHVLLQFTGLYDKEGEEIYDMDVLLLHAEKYLVFWNEEMGGWFFSLLTDRSKMEPFLEHKVTQMKRFCSFFETESN